MFYLSLDLISRLFCLHTTSTFWASNEKITFNVFQRQFISYTYFMSLELIISISL